MKNRIIFSFLSVFILTIFNCYSQDTIRIQIINDLGEPILGVDVTNPEVTYRYGNCDINGEIEFILKKDDVSVLFSHVGYNEKIIEIKDLKKMSIVVLETKIYEMDDVVVTAGPPLDVSINRIREAQKKVYRRKKQLRYYGFGVFAKIVESKNKTIQARHDYGPFLTTGNSKKTDMIDSKFLYRHVPMNSAVSHQLTSDGKDTLEREYFFSYENPKIDYRSGSIRTFDIIRSIYLYGPIFSNPKDFIFKPVSKDGNISTVSFQTKGSSFPKKNRCLSVGTMKIDVSTNKLIQMDFNFFEYSLNSYYLDKKIKNFQSKTEVSVKIEYDIKGQAYISECRTTITWNNDKRISGTILPPRPFSGTNQIVEKEYWECHSYRPIPKDIFEIFTKSVPKMFIDNKECNPGNFDEFLFGSARDANIEDNYNEELFDKVKFPISSSDNFEQMNAYMPLKEQYKQNSGKLGYWNGYYSPEGFLSYDLSKFSDYYKKMDGSRILLINVFHRLESQNRRLELKNRK